MDCWTDSAAVRFHLILRTVVGHILGVKAQEQERKPNSQVSASARFSPDLFTKAKSPGQSGLCGNAPLMIKEAGKFSTVSQDMKSF